MGIEYANPPLPDVLSAAAHTVVRDQDGVRRSARLPFWDVAWSGAVPFTPNNAQGTGGTAYASMTDSATAIANAIATAKTLGLPVVGKGRYRVDSTITIDTDADFSCAEFVCSDTALTVARVGTATASTAVKRIRVALPKVIQAAKTGTGWTGTSIGVALCNLSRSEVILSHVQGFTDGLKLTTSGTMGCDYNTVIGGHLDNNKRNLHLSPADTNGWTNENVFVGTSFSHDSNEGTLVSGTRHILLTGVGTTQPNNNTWVKPSLESPGVVEYEIYSIGGIYNRWIQGRYEHTGANPRVSWDQVDAARHSRDNVIDGGYNVDAIEFTVSADSVRNHLRGTQTWVFDGSAANGVLRGTNANTDTTGLRWYDITTDVLAAGAADWRWDWAASQVRVKAKADTVARWSVNTATGTHSWGPGNAAADTNLYRNGANVLKTDDKLIAAFGIGVGNSAAATTPGTVVRKMEVFDANGSSLGFVAIYDGIS